MYELIKEYKVNKNDKVKAIALCRVSTVKQGVEGSSLEAQEQRVYDAALLFNAEIVKFWSITQSSRKGKNYQRKDLMEMLAFAKADKRVKYIIVDEPDRFMRDLEMYYHWKVQFREVAGAKLVYAKKPHLAEDTSMVATMEEMIDVFRGEASNLERITKTTSNMQARVAAVDTTLATQKLATSVPKRLACMHQMSQAGRCYALGSCRYWKVSRLKM